MVAIYAVSRVLFAVSGVRFDASSLNWGWQHVDPVLLRNELAESLFYLHSQPPLFNLFLGVVLKLAGGAASIAFHGAFLLTGLLLYLVLFDLLVRVGVRRVTAVAASTLFVLSPSYVLYEHWLFYTLPLAALVGLAGWTLAALCVRKSAPASFAFFGSVGLLCLLHGIFHVVYLLGALALVLSARLVSPRMAIAAAAAPLLIVLSLYGKNAVLFGEFGASSWTGMNMALRRLEALPYAERERLQAQGTLSEVASIEPFRPLSDYPERFRAVPPEFASIPVLAEPFKAGKDRNLNHYGYVALAEHYARDTRYVITHYPTVLMASLFGGWHEYFRSSSDYEFLEPNLRGSALVRAQALVFDQVLYGVLSKGGPGLLLVVFIPLLVFVTLRQVLAGSSDGSPQVSDPQRIVLAFSALTILFVAVVANTVNTIENMRLRFMTDPLLVVLAAFWGERWIASLGRRRRAH